MKLKPIFVLPILFALVLVLCIPVVMLAERGVSLEGLIPTRPEPEILETEPPTEPEETEAPTEEETQDPLELCQPTYLITAEDLQKSAAQTSNANACQ